MHKIFCLVVCFLSFSALGIDPEVTEIKVDKWSAVYVDEWSSVYTMETETAAGEKIYFALEPLDHNNRQSWMDYLSAANEFAAYVARNLPNIHAGLGFALTLTGGFPQELVDLIQKRELEKPEKAGKLTKIYTGTTALNTRASYIAYASKKPVTGFCPHPREIHDLKGQQQIIPFPPVKINAHNFDAYREAYGDILMCVGVSLFHGRDAYENRGIFRNPLSIIEGTHKDISMLLHAFTAKVLREHKKQNYLFVNAAPSMSILLKRKLTENSYFTLDNLPSQFSWLPRAYEHVDKLFVIPVGTLTALLESDL